MHTARIQRVKCLPINTGALSLILVDVRNIESGEKVKGVMEIILLLFNAEITGERNTSNLTITLRLSMPSFGQVWKLKRPESSDK